MRRFATIFSKKNFVKVRKLKKVFVLRKSVSETTNRCTNSVIAYLIIYVSRNGGCYVF